MRNFLLLCMAALCCLACNDSKIVTVTVTNPLAMDRSDEMVEVSMTEISNLLNLADTAQIVVLNVEGEQVPYQVTYDDKLIFPATVAANASAAYTVQAGTPVDVGGKGLWAAVSRTSGRHGLGERLGRLPCLRSCIAGKG